MEILTRLQKEILECLKEIPDKEAFYLTGGTALSAFYLKHFTASSPEMDFLVKPCDFKELQEFFGRWRQEILKELKG